MHYTGEFRRDKVACGIADEVATVIDRSSKVMEICAGHTHAIFKYDLNDLFPPQLTALHGPGCPVCELLSARYTLRCAREGRRPAQLDDYPSQAG